MINPRELFLKQLVLLIDAALLVICFVLAYHFRESAPQIFTRWDFLRGRDVLEPFGRLENYLWLLLFILPIWLGLLSVLGGYRELRMKSYLSMVWTILWVSVLGLIGFGSLMYLLKLHFVSRAFLVIFLALSFSLLSLGRAVLLFIFHLMLRRGYFVRSLLIVGTGRRARRFAQVVRAHANWGLKIVGFLDEDPRLIGHRVEGIEVLAILADLPRILKERVIDEVVFVIPRNWMARMEPWILQCELVGVRATVAMDLFNLRFAKAQPTDLDGIPLISFDTTPMDQWKLAVKRTLDFLAAAAGLVALLPVFIVIAAAIKLTSPGPVFFRQVRCGLNGRRFKLYKFRSMVRDAEARRAELEHLNEMGGPVFKMARDPRLTLIGRLIRKTSVDELPQLINVVRGEMSLVGPRPPIPSEVAKYEPWQRRRLSMRPGITGYWQVSGRNKVKDFNQWTRLDLEYIDRWSLKLDVEILLKTVPAVAFGVGAK
jgi:exopolysaccharide biosynthesis polyprenyl glycosylphosphotransferase